MLKRIDALLAGKKDSDAHIFEAQLEKYFGNGVSVLPGYGKFLQYLRTQPAFMNESKEVVVFLENLKTIQNSKRDLRRILVNFAEEIKKVIHSKAKALERLINDKLETPFKKLCIEAILKNPAQIPIASSLVLKSIKQPEAKETCIRFANAVLPETSFMERMEVLSYLQKNALKGLEVNGLEPPKIMIVGAGPAGITRAILAALCGCEIQIIEKRKEETEARPNVLVLGKNSDQHWIMDDMKLLKFLGLQTHLNENDKWGTF